MHLPRVLLTLGFLSLLVGCPEAPFNPPVELDCGGEGHPCSLSQVPLETLQRGESLGDQILAMLANGSSMADALFWIQAQEGVVESAGNDNGIRFRLDGGRDVWIMSASALASNQPNTTARSVARHLKPPTTARIVGDDNPDKQALVLSPFYFQFQPNDDAASVAQMLATTRGYDTGVVLMQNETEESNNVGISQFKDWDQYDVIHVSSHGITICDLSLNCAATICTGDRYETAEDLLQITEAGVNTVRIEGEDVRFFGVSADFFRSTYPGGLDNKIVMISACQTIGSGDDSLAQAIVGDSSVYLGWNNIVEATASTAASIAFFEHLTNQGVTAQSAYDLLGPLRDDAYVRDGVEAEANLLILRPGEQDLRVRDVVTLKHPSSGSDLASGAVVVGQGTADDGQEDLMPYSVLVEGVEPGQEDLFSVQVCVGGYCSTPSPASAGEVVNERGRLLSGAFPIGSRTTAQTLSIRAVLQLPEGGTSEYSAEVDYRLGSEDEPPDDEPPAGLQPEIWTGTTTSFYESPITKLRITISTIVTWEQDADSIGERYKYFHVKQGTMTWSISGEIARAFDDPCPFSDGPVSVPIEPDDGSIKIDTGVDPPTYTLFGSTQGPEVKVGNACDDYAYTTSADGVWGYPVINSDNKPVSGNVIAGTASDSSQSWEWTFTKQQ